MPSTHFLVSALLATAVTLTSAKLCPPLGRTLPPPQSPSSNAGVKSAATSLANELQTLFSSTLKASGVSVSVKSLHEDAPLFNYHFTPPVLSGVGTSKIDEHTIYRVGSISKMMPALAALQRSEIDMHASVLKYLPDLRTKTHVHPDIHAIPWEDITVDSLASHLAGLPTDSKFKTFITIYINTILIAKKQWLRILLSSPMAHGPKWAFQLFAQVLDQIVLDYLVPQHAHHRIF